LEVRGREWREAKGTDVSEVFEVIDLKLATRDGPSDGAEIEVPALEHGGTGDIFEVEAEERLSWESFGGGALRGRGSEVGPWIGMRICRLSSSSVEI